MLKDVFSFLGGFLNEMSNDGAKAQFTTYLINDILPVMVHCARVSIMSCIVIVAVADRCGLLQNIVQQFNVSVQYTHQLECVCL